MAVLVGYPTNKLILMIDGDAVDGEVTSAKVAPRKAESGVVTFAGAREGGAYEWVGTFTAIQGAKVFDLLWSKRGQSIPVIFKPYGNATASVSQPHWKGNVTVTLPESDLIGGDADGSTSSRFLFTVEWVFDAEPTRVTS